MATILYFDVGGRPYNSQDFAALQSQVVDATQVYSAFNNGGNYVIQGCVTLGASGTVWINGRVRNVQTSVTVTGSTPYPVYIVNQDSVVSRVYQDGNAKAAFDVYEAIWTASTPAQGASFVAFNNVNDLNNLRLSTF